MSCTVFKPACPIIPTYPGAVAITYTEVQETTRTTTYTTHAVAQDILSYYLKSFEETGWSTHSKDAHMINLGYVTSNNHPPFNGSVIIDEETTGSTQFRVSISINGPFFWENWCPTLKP
jgi:hypothetical protein